MPTAADDMVRYRKSLERVKRYFAKDLAQMGPWLNAPREELSGRTPGRALDEGDFALVDSILEGMEKEPLQVPERRRKRGIMRSARTLIG